MHDIRSLLHIFPFERERERSVRGRGREREKGEKAPFHPSDLRRNDRSTVEAHSELYVQNDGNAVAVVSTMGMVARI